MVSIENPIPTLVCEGSPENQQLVVGSICETDEYDNKWKSVKAARKTSSLWWEASVKQMSMTTSEREIEKGESIE